MAQKEHTDIPYPALIMIRGLPGSGKSYLAAALEKEVGKEHLVILDPDTVDQTDKAFLAFSDELTKEGLDKAIHPFRWSRKLACDAVSDHKIIIWNQPFTNQGIFDRLVAFIQAYADEHDIDLPVLLVEVEIDHATAKERITKRKQAGGHGPTDGTFARRVDEYVSYADNYRTVVVEGQGDVEASVAAVMPALQDLARQST
jgi:predicted kinase